MYLYSIMPLFTDHLEEICKDIEEQVKTGVADCPLFSMTLVPEGNPPIDKVGLLCKKYDLFRNRLQEMGLPSGILVQATLGHGYVLDEMFPFTKYVNMKTGTEEAVCCPLDEDFRTHLREMFHTIASHKPDTVMLDDDFRLIFRPGGGCACRLHMEDFNRRAGTDFSRQELHEALNRKDGEGDRYRSLYVASQQDSLLDAAREIRRGIDEVNPHLNCSFCSTGGYSCGSGPELAQILAGEGNPVIMRGNNALYTTPGARNLSHCMFKLANQKAQADSKVDYILAETDTCPHNRYSTGAHSVHSHLVGSILEGAVGAKHWITRLKSYEPKSGLAYRKKMGSHRGMYEKLVEIYPTLRYFGCCMPLNGRNRLPVTDDKSAWEPYSIGWLTCVLERLGLPVYYQKNPTGVCFMDGRADEDFTGDEILSMLSHSLFLASDTAKRLIDRGFGEYLGVDVRPWEGAPVSDEFLFINDHNVSSQYNLQELVPLSENVEVKSVSFHLENGKDRRPLFPGVTLFRNSLGGSSVVFCGTPNAPFHYGTAFSFLAESRKLQLISLLEEVGYPLPLYYPDDAEMYMKAAYMEDGALFCAAFNLGLDVLDDLPLYVKEKVTSVEKMSPEGKWESIAFREEPENRITVETPVYTLDPVILRIVTE